MPPEQSYFQPDPSAKTKPPFNARPPLIDTRPPAGASKSSPQKRKRGYSRTIKLGRKQEDDARSTPPTAHLRWLLQQLVNEAVRCTVRLNTVQTSTGAQKLKPQLQQLQLQQQQQQPQQQPLFVTRHKPASSINRAVVSRYAQAQLAVLGALQMLLGQLQQGCKLASGKLDPHNMGTKLIT